MGLAFGIASFLLALASIGRADQTTYNVNAICTADQMMRYYGISNAGLWGGSWWESAILMASLADISSLDSSFNGSYFATFATTYSEAPNFYSYTGFINEYYDDEGWWANAWVTVYDLTENPAYLEMAISIYNDITQGQSHCGGIYWEKGNPYIAAIANELYITLAASLANRVPSDQKQTYLDEAKDKWDWFFSSGIVGSDNLVVDGVDNSTCQPTGNKYSYNQGVILGGAVELYKATGDTTYLELAGSIANATTASGSTFTNDNGIITDCDSGCDDQGAMFKGPLFRGMRMLQLVDPHSNWEDWITANAQSLWQNALDVTYVDGNYECNTGYDFTGPMTSVSEVTQGAALDCLVAAWAVTE